mgnify:CR=1 FL=1
MAGHENIDKVRILYSVSKGYYCKVEGNVVVNQDFLNRVTIRMRDIVEADIPIKKEKCIDTGCHSAFSPVRDGG